MSDKIVYSNNHGYVLDTIIGKNKYYVVYRHEGTTAKKVATIGQKYADAYKLAIERL